MPTVPPSPFHPGENRTTNASEIAPGVFVGGWGDALGFRGQRICVLDEPPGAEAPANVHLPVYDGGRDAPIMANLERIVELVAAARGQGEPVLLFCGHGVRRGPLAGAWYLHRRERIPLQEAYRRIRAVRPRVELAGKWIGHPEILESEAPPPPRSPDRGSSPQGSTSP
jgi:hypothetical protein